MAGQQINMTLRLDSNISNETNEAKKLNKELEKAKSTASSMGGTAGSRKVAASAAAVPASRSKADPEGELNSYGVARGAVGTGAAGRDFAKQAQGLGGLVHVYATFAANIFAVSAAFEALKKAADTTNMVEGLNQLGAASGKNLGNMAKNVVALSDGAVSLRQAMEATAQATAGGMTGEQLQRMTKVAKSAAQALGRDMGDALTRLSRGITKIEPELLDELGIMVRVDKAAADYARTLGKTAVSLSEFERRQAFAIAVLKQGEDKFGRIKIDANPYSKLEASFMNLAQAGGELINKILGPIAKILAESPTALGTAMAGIAAMLLSKAIPAMTQWRKGLIEAAEEAEKSAKRTAEAHQIYKINKEIAMGRESLAPLEAQLTQSMNTIRDKLTEALPKTSKLIANTLSDAFDPSKEAKKYETAAKRMEREISAMESAKKTLTDAQIKLVDIEIEKKRQSIKLLKQANAVALNQVDIQKAITAEMQKQEAISANPTLYEKFLGANAKRAESKATSARILADVAVNTQEMGPVDSFKKLLGEVAESKADKKLGTVRAGLTVISGTARIAGAALMTVVSALSNVFMVIGVLTSAFAILDGWLSTSSKEQEEFKGTIDNTSSAIKGLANTLEYTSSEALKPDNIQAYANAIQEVSNSAQKLVTDFQNLQKASSWWDNSLNFIKKIWGGDKESKLAESLASTITATLDALDTPEAQKKFRESLGISNKSGEGLKEYIEELADAGNTTELNKMAKASASMSKEISVSASNLTAYVDASNQAAKAAQTLTNSFLPSDAMSKFGVDQINMAKSLAKSLEDPKIKLAALKATFEDVSKVALFEGQLDTSISAKTAEISKKVEMLKQGIQSAKEQMEEIGTPMADNLNAVRRKEYLQGLIDQSQGAIQKLYAESAKLSTDIAARLFELGSKKLQRGITDALAQGALQIEKTLAQGIGGPEGAKAELQLQLKEFDLRVQQIKATEDLVVEMKLANLNYEYDKLKEKAAQAKPEEKASFNKSMKDIETARGVLSSKNRTEQLRNLYAKDEEGNQVYGTGVQALIGDTQQQLLSVDKEKALLSAQKMVAVIAGELKIAKEKKQVQIDDNRRLLERNTLEQTRFDKLIQTGVLIDNNTVQEQAALTDTRQQLERRNLLLEQEQNLLAVNLAISKEKDKKQLEEYKSHKARLEAQHEIVLATKTEEQKQAKIQKTIELVVKGLEQAVQLRERELSIVKELEDNQSSILKSYISILDTSGAITKSKSLELNRELDLRKAASDGAKKLRDIEDEANKKKLEITEQIKAITDPESSDYERLLALRDREEGHYSRKKAAQEEINRLTEQQIILQAAYQIELAKVEDTLRRMEKEGQGLTGDYLSTVAEDFTNKVTAAARAAKSAASVLNEGIINAIDSSIDRFYEMMQKSEFNLKELVKFARNSLSDAFRESAAQLAKNAWKDMLGGILPKTAAEKAQDNLIIALNNLRDAILGKSKSYGAGGDGTELMYGSAEGDKKQEQAIDKFGQKTDTFGGTIKQFGTDVQALVKGQMSVTDVFKNLIGNLGSTFTSFLISLGSTLSSSFAVGASGGGGLLGGIAGLFGFSSSVGTAAANTPAALDVLTSLWEYKQGGVVDGSKALSGYSNSIVSSPTLFAFAKGAGLMGEAGPEAIMPLKRDAQGNLGVRATTGEVTNNVSVTVNIENGKASDGQVSTQQGGADLGNAIKAVVVQELIKQSRPGGLLAK